MESRKRILRACDFCHHRGIKCVGRADDGATPCKACQRYNIPCASERPQKKRGPVPRHRPSSASRSEPEGDPSPSVKSSDETPERLDNPFGPWQPLVIVPLAPLLKVLTIYHETAYPIFPFFVWPTFIDKVARKEHLDNRAFYGAVMAAAALALARTRDAATPSRAMSKEEAETLPAPEVLFAAAEDAVPKDLATAEDFDYVRASALLALVGIQFARPRKLQQHLGTYSTLCSVNRLHDERRWEANLSTIEREERRRIIWSMYTLELFAALSFGGTLRSRQTSLRVQYPLVTDESLISSSGDPAESPASAATTWLTGWNFVTELYKTLEYALDSTQDPARSSSSSPATILDYLDAIYSTLPPIFKEMRSFIGDTQYDRFGYQTANIRVTLQTVKMVAVCRDLTEASRREQAVQIAETLLQDVNAVPLPYLQAISSPLLHHLVGIYKLILPITEHPLTPDLFLRIRQILIGITTLLQRLQSRLTYTTNAIQRFQSQIVRMDAAQTAGQSRPPSPPANLDPPPVAGPPFPGAEIDESTNLLPWEAAFELHDVFSEWPFDFDGNRSEDPLGLFPSGGNELDLSLVYGSEGLQ